MDHRLSPGLLDGYRRFRATRYATERERYRELGEGAQAPGAMIIACSDSRAAPETIFDAGPGELFVVRNVAALVPAYEPDEGKHGASAALEFAVRSLRVPSVVVMGHGRCGGIAAALAADAGVVEGTDFIGRWVEDVRALGVTMAHAGPGAQRALEHRSVEQSLAHLETFPWVADRVAAGDLTLHAAWFDIALGELHELGPDGWQPARLTAAAAT